MRDGRNKLTKCVTGQGSSNPCPNDSTERSHWCQQCRTSFRRWLDMSDAERKASWWRAAYRWNRVNKFRGWSGKVVQMRARRPA